MKKLGDVLKGVASVLLLAVLAAVLWLTLQEPAVERTTESTATVQKGLTAMAVAQSPLVTPTEELLPTPTPTELSPQSPLPTSTEESTPIPLPTPTPVPTLALPTPFTPPVRLPESLHKLVFAVKTSHQPFLLWQLEYDANIQLVSETEIARPILRGLENWEVVELVVSPDGKKVGISLCFEACAGTKVVIIDLEVGSTREAVFPPPYLGETWLLDWLPDSQGVLLDALSSHVWGTIGIDGADQQYFPIGDLLWIEDAAISPDGKTIVVSGPTSFAFVDATGHMTHVIRFPKDTPGVLMRNLTWSPDGKGIAYTWDKPVGRYGDGELWLMDAQGDNQKRLGQSGAHDLAPTWSSDSRYILFVRRENDEDLAAEYGPENLVSSLWVVDVATKEERQLVESVGKSHWSPAWLPDGSAVIFISNRGGTSDLWLVNSDGSGLQQLTDHGGVVGGMAVLP